MYPLNITRERPALYARGKIRALFLTKKAVYPSLLNKQGILYSQCSLLAFWALMYLNTLRNIACKHITRVQFSPTGHIRMPALTFFKCSPGGNPTLLLPDTGLGPAQQAHVAETLLSPQHLYAEQVGFVNLRLPSLRMAGGEFCVNATRSLGAVLAAQNLLHTREDGVRHTSIQVSGMDAPIQVEVRPLTPLQQSIVHVTAIVPMSGMPPCETLAEGIVLVRLQGIVHVLVDNTLHPLSADWQQDAARIRQRFELEQYEAVGCIWWQHAGQAVNMQPIVWVRDLGSACFESSCGSGSMAYALYRYSRTADQHKGQQATDQAAPYAEGHYTLLQPSGVPLHICCQQGQQHGLTVRISGPVSIVAEGTVYLDNLPPLA